VAHSPVDQAEKLSLEQLVAGRRQLADVASDPKKRLESRETSLEPLKRGQPTLDPVALGAWGLGLGLIR